jgi:hypothetical protein
MAIQTFGFELTEVGLVCAPGNPAYAYSIPSAFAL